MITDEIQQEIERTRGEMAGTLQAIASRYRRTLVSMWTPCAN